MAKQRTNSTKSSNGANLGFEQKLWAAADKLRGHMDAAEYKHVVLGLIFPQLHLRRLPGTLRGPQGAPMRRSRGPGRVHRRKRVLGPEGGPLGPHPRERQA